MCCMINKIIEMFQNTESKSNKMNENENISSINQLIILKMNNSSMIFF